MVTVIGKPTVAQIVKALEQVYEYGGGKWKVEVQGNDKGKEHKRFGGIA